MFNVLNPDILRIMRVYFPKYLSTSPAEYWSMRPGEKECEREPKKGGQVNQKGRRANRVREE
jgi:hypothetical protein